MKKVKFFLGAIAVAVAVFFTSCNPETTVELTVDPFDTTAVPGDVVTFNYTLTPDVNNNGELGEFSIESDSIELYTETFSGSSSKSGTYDYTVPTDATEGDIINLTFRAIDGKSGKENSTVATITVGSDEPEYPEIVESTGNTVNYNSTSTTTEFGWQLESTAKGVVITQVDSDDADLVYFWNNTYGQQLLSPDANQIMEQEGYSNWSYSLSGKKTTKIQSATASDYADADSLTVNNISITDSETHPGGGNGIDDVAEGDYFIIELDDGRKGVVKVSGSNPAYGYEKGEKIESSITLDFKFQATPYNAGK